MKNFNVICLFVALFFFTQVTRGDWFSWEARTGQTGDQLGIFGQDMNRRGYTPKDISTVSNSDDLSYSTVWVKTPYSDPFVLKTKMSGQEFQNHVDEMKQKGYSPRDVAVSTTINGITYFSGIWEKVPGRSWQLWSDLTKEQVEARTKQYSALGLVLFDINAYESRGEIRYSAIWTEVDTENYNFFIGLNVSEFQTALNNLPKNFVPVKVDVADVYGQPVFSMIATQDNSFQWESKHGLDPTAFQSYFDKQVDRGFVLESVSSYIEEGNLKYGGVFTREIPSSGKTEPLLDYNVNPQSRSSKTLPIRPVYQQTKVWCWLAVGEMIFKHYGLPNQNPVGNYQCGIIGTIAPNSPCASNCFNGVCIIPSGSNYNTVKMLKDYSWATSKMIFDADEAQELSFEIIKENIDRNAPILAGISPNRRQYYFGAEHVVLIVGYEQNESGVSLVINDPFPYSVADNPYARAGATQVRDYQYKIPLKTFAQGIFWHWSIYNISIR